MATLQIHLNDDLHAAALTQATAEGFESVETYIAHLIAADVPVPISAELEEELMKGLNSGPGRVITDSDWEQKRQELRARAAERAAL